MSKLIGFQLSPDGEIVDPNLHDMELRGVDFPNGDGIILRIASNFSDAVRIELSGVNILSLTTDHMQNVIYAAYVFSPELLLRKAYLASYVSGVLRCDITTSRYNFFVLEPAAGISLIAQLKENFSITVL